MSFCNVRTAKTTNRYIVGLSLIFMIVGCNQNELARNAASAEAAKLIAQANSEADSKVRAREIIRNAEKVAEEKSEAERRKLEGWSYRQQIDEMTGGVTEFATVDAQNALKLAFPSTGLGIGSLMLRARKREGETVIFVMPTAQITCDDPCRLRVRFDDRPVQSFEGALPRGQGRESIAIFPSNKFIAELKKSTRVRVEATYYRHGPRISDFNVQGLEWGKKKLTYGPRT